MDTQATAGDITFPPGTKLREYETIYLVRPDFGDDNTDKLKEKIRSVIAREGGKAIKFTIWGRKKVQYEIGGQNRAVFTHVLYLGPSKLVAEVERNLRMTDDVLRFQTIKLADESDAGRPVEADVKLAGDVESERPPREERERRLDDDMDGPDFGGDEGDEA